MNQSSSDCLNGSTQPRNKSLYGLLANSDSNWSLRIMIVVHGARNLVAAFNDTDSASGREILVTQAYVDKYKQACRNDDLRKLTDLMHELNRALDDIVRVVPRTTSYIATSGQVAYGPRVI
jgi:hypothetical protein